MGNDNQQLGASQIDTEASGQISAITLQPILSKRSLQDGRGDITLLNDNIGTGPVTALTNAEWDQSASSPPAILDENLF
jgi:hypothetical protein